MVEQQTRNAHQNNCDENIYSNARRYKRYGAGKMSVVERYLYISGYKRFLKTLHSNVKAVH